MKTLVGRTLDGKYQLAELIGEGGMGWVFRANDLRFERELAVKILRPEFLSSDDLVRRFYREAKAAGRLRSRHVVSIYDFGRTDEGAYIAMELSRGTCLADILSYARKLAPRRVVNIGSQIASALHEAHALGIIHRDMKTDNVLVERDFAGNDFALILDFGIARQEGSRSIETLAGAVFGTPVYMAPEQCRGEVADGRTDLYALGVILYEMLAGGPPFLAKSGTEIMRAHIQDAPRPIAAYAEVPPELASLVMALLSKVRGERPQTGEEVQQRLLEALVDRDTIPPPPKVEKPTIGDAEKAMLGAVASTLTETLGPISNVVVAREIERILKGSGRLGREEVFLVVERVSARIKDADKRRNFLQTIRKVLDA